MTETSPIEVAPTPAPTRRIYLFGQAEQRSGLPTPAITGERWQRVSDALEGRPVEFTPELLSDLVAEFAAQERFRSVMQSAGMQALSTFKQYAAGCTTAHEATFRAADAYAAGHAAGKYEAYARASSMLADVINRATAEGFGGRLP